MDKRRAKCSYAKNGKWKIENFIYSFFLTLVGLCVRNKESYHKSLKNMVISSTSFAFAIIIIFLSIQIRKKQTDIFLVAKRKTERINSHREKVFIFHLLFIRIRIKILCWRSCFFLFLLLQISEIFYYNFQISMESNGIEVNNEKNIK